ncbi:MAG: AI-2E family transporter, partial [Crocosphaera sp.]
QLQPLFREIFTNFFTVFSNSLAVILQLIFIFVLTIMMIIDPQKYRRLFLKLFPSFYRKRGEEILTLSEVALGNWLAGITINCLFIGSLSGLGLWFLQVKLVLVHALLAGILNFIPNVGPATSVIFPLMVALLDEPWKIWAIIIWYFIIQNIESYWLTPTVMAKQVSLLPAMTLMAQIFFAKSFGILGLLLALPLAVVAKTWIEEILFKDILDPWNSVV